MNPRPVSPNSINSVLITGTSSGLGESLAALFLKQGLFVTGIARRMATGLMQNENYRHICANLGLGNNARIVQNFPVEFSPNLLILNAGHLGDIGPLATAQTNDLRYTMEVNLWSVQELLAALAQAGKLPGQVLYISSGAAVRGRKGWGGYALSKSAGNMLMQIWADEFPATHFTSLAPGLVDTPMQAILSTPGQVIDDFPSQRDLLQARAGGHIHTSQQVAGAIIQLLPKLQKISSGSFIDLRRLPPELQ